MNKINQLFDKEFVLDYFQKKLLPHYPDFYKIKNIKIIGHKKFIWEHTYHVVIEFRTTLISKEGKTIKLPIFCSAHSNEPRKNVYTSLKYLWDNGFHKGHLSIPHPLFYSKYFNGTFYRGVNGKHLYHFIREGNKKEIENLVPKAAHWFAKLHHGKKKDPQNFNPDNSRIKTVTPGAKHIIERIHYDYPEYLDFYKSAYKFFIKKEEEFLNSTEKKWLVHGDAHPENIIKMGKVKIGLIDFTDLCLSDFARDLGSFTQQLEFMSNRKIKNEKYAKKICDLFLISYFSKVPKLNITPEIKERIDLYYYWTATRTATHFLMKDGPEPERATPLINRIKNFIK